MAEESAAIPAEGLTDFQFWTLIIAAVGLLGLGTIAAALITATTTRRRERSAWLRQEQVERYNSFYRNMVAVRHHISATTDAALAHIHFDGLQEAVDNAFFTSYVPSALFPKAAIDRFFSKYQPIDDSQTVSDALWRYGKRVVKSLRTGKSSLAIEITALTEFVNSGIVHVGVPDYEISHASRLSALRIVRDLAASRALRVIPGPLPYVFRLVPPHGVLIDVDRNMIEQKVQGLWIDDKDVYKTFAAEARRLTSEPTNLEGPKLVGVCESAIQRLERGHIPFWQ